MLSKPDDGAKEWALLNSADRTSFGVIETPAHALTKFD
jgi:hypothetical protein